MSGGIKKQFQYGGRWHHQYGFVCNLLKGVKNCRQDRSNVPLTPNVKCVEFFIFGWDILLRKISNFKKDEESRKTENLEFSLYFLFHFILCIERLYIIYFTLN